MNPLYKWIGDFVHPPKEARLDLGRRAVLAAGLAGLGAKLLFGIDPQASKRSFNPALIRPRGRSRKTNSSPGVFVVVSA